jgi:hypothetical protein
MRRRSLKALVAVLMFAGLALAPCACEEHHEGPAEVAGKKIDQGAQKLGEKMEEGGEKLQHEAGGD